MFGKTHNENTKKLMSIKKSIRPLGLYDENNNLICLRPCPALIPMPSPYTLTPYRAGRRGWAPLSLSLSFASHMPLRDIGLGWAGPDARPYSLKGWDGPERERKIL